MAQCFHIPAPMWLPSEVDRRAETLKVWAEAVVRRELKLALRRAGVPFNPDDSTLVLGVLQELVHRGSPCPSLTPDLP